MRRAAPRSVSGRGCTTVAERTPPIRLSRSDGASGSSARAPSVISSGRSSIRRARYDSTSSEGRSAHWASSITSASGCLVGQRRAQPEHAVGDHHRRVAVGHGALEEEPAGGARGALEQPRALLLGGVAQRRLQQRADHPEGEVALQRPRDRPAHEAARVLGQGGAVLEQRASCPGRRGPRGRPRRRCRPRHPRTAPERTQSSTARSISGGVCDAVTGSAPTTCRCGMRDDRATDHEGPDA